MNPLPPQAQGPPGRALHAELLSLEVQLLDAYSRRSRRDLERLLAPEFREFAAHGAVLVRAAILEALESQPAHLLSLTDFTSHMLGPDAVLTTYIATSRRDPASPGRRSLRSSVWQRRERGWHLLFHQGTRAPEPGA